MECFYSVLSFHSYVPFLANSLVRTRKRDGLEWKEVRETSAQHNVVVTNSQKRASKPDLGWEKKSGLCWQIKLWNKILKESNYGIILLGHFNENIHGGSNFLVAIIAHFCQLAYTLNFPISPPQKRFHGILITRSFLHKAHCKAIRHWQNPHKESIDNRIPFSSVILFRVIFSPEWCST